ncbi:PF20097 family protein [Pirellulaceae bacterium]|jgi:hypothetical protein|nr:PF20097 family protein [Pirellulaceae bacterium]
MNCQKCGFEMESGYSAANSSLSWIEKDKFQSFCFVDEDLAKLGWKSLLPATPARYFSADHCSKCKTVVIDYSNTMDRVTVEARL